MKIKNKLSNLAWRRLRSRGLLVAVGAAALLAAACTDDDLATDKSNKRTGTALAFNVSDVQMDALAQNGAGQTRGLSMQSIPASYLAPRKIDATGNNPHDFCLIESTVEGLNPVKVDAKTRGTILTASTLGTFSSIGYRAASPTAAANPSTALLWFHGEKTNPDGTLQSRYDWDWPVNVYGRFYAVSPEATAANGITLSPSNYAQVPYVDFEVKSNVVDQVDLMTACSGEVHYEHGNDPTSNLKFTHALAAVKFSIGSNLSPVIIEKIEVSGVKYKGRYELPNALNAMGTWTSVDNATTTVTLSGINMDAADRPNTMLAGALTPDPHGYNVSGRQNYTFLMIPQTLPARGAANPAKVTIYYEDHGTTKHISFPLTGEWKANTTREYKLSQKNTTWEYRFSMEDDEEKTFTYDANYEGTVGSQFKVTSYREAPDGTHQQPIAWKVSKYEEWDYATNSWVDKGTTKPAWLGNITDHGNGGTAADVVNTAVQAATITDRLTEYNQRLKDAPAKGMSTPWNLANPATGGSDITETANSYLISAPGRYRIPLVYGNGIQDNQYNSQAYHLFIIIQPPYSQYSSYQDLKDHADKEITEALINKQNSTDKATQASVVWMDHPNLVHFDGSPIKSYPVTIKDKDGATAATQVDFVEFEVKKNDIHNGNAVIAVKNAAGTIMWSWHLWFDTDDALDPIPVKNHAGKEYIFTRNTLGAVHEQLEETPYYRPRKARLTIMQQATNHGRQEKGQVVIVQNPGRRQKDFSTLYAYGRKDAFPGTATFYPANAVTTVPTLAGSHHHTYGEVIRNPAMLPVEDYSGYPWPTGYGFDWGGADELYYWSGHWSLNDKSSLNLYDPPAKTIYDPCPAGFHVPLSTAFTGFTTTGQNTTSPSELNVEGAFHYGWNFKTNVGNGTIFIPMVPFLNTASQPYANLLSDQRDVNPSIAYGIYRIIDADEYGNFDHTVDWNFSKNGAGISVSSTSGMGLSIRPVTERRPKVTPKTPESSMKDWQEEEIDGGTVKKHH